MAIDCYTLNAHQRFDDQLDRILRANYPEIKKVTLCQDPAHAGYLLAVERVDWGVWEWNDDIIAQ